MRTLANGKPLPQRTVNHNNRTNANTPTRNPFWPVFTFVKACKAFVWFTAGTGFARSTSDTETMFILGFALLLTALFSFANTLFKEACNATYNRP